MSVGVLDVTAPYLIFAKVDNDLGNINIVIPETKIAYIINPIRITTDLFRKAFFYSSTGPNNISENLTYFNPTTIPDWLSEENVIRLKNILNLSSGGGTIPAVPVDGVTPEILPRKTITVNNTATDFIIGSFIVDDIVNASDKDYDTWSYDSQLNLSKKLATITYIYDFPISPTTTNSLTWSELVDSTNALISKYKIENSSDIQAGQPFPVNLNFVVTFKSVVGATDQRPNPDEVTSTTVVTTLLYQFKITDWIYGGAFN
jgi:hypothetical protein